MNYETNLNDKHLQATSLTGTTMFYANHQDILKEKKFQISHYITFYIKT